MRKRPEIPEDMFFDTGPADEESEEAGEPDAQPEPEPDAELGDDVLQKSVGERAGERRGTYTKLSDYRAAQARGRTEASGSRVGRPPAQEGPKVAVTLYLTEPVAHLLEEVKFVLLTEYDVKTSKSAIADFALRHGLRDLQAAADDLRRD